jgi:hypothetical protein
MRDESLSICWRPGLVETSTACRVPIPSDRPHKKKQRPTTCRAARPRTTLRTRIRNTGRSSWYGVLPVGTARHGSLLGPPSKPRTIIPIIQPPSCTAYLIMHPYVKDLICLDISSGLMEAIDRSDAGPTKKTTYEYVSRSGPNFLPTRHTRRRRVGGRASPSLSQFVTFCPERGRRVRQRHRSV